MKKFSLLSILFCLLFSIAAYAQNFRAKQASQERTIRIAYKKGKITEREYQKLMDEQDVIKATIRKYEADHYLTPHEKNVIHDKLVRAEKRLRRYKANSEIY